MIPLQNKPIEIRVLVAVSPFYYNLTGTYSRAELRLLKPLNYVLASSVELIDVSGKTAHKLRRIFKFL